MSPELERVREKLYERAGITLTNLFERLVREDQSAALCSLPPRRSGMGNDPAERPHPIRRGHDDPVSHDDAMAAACRLINSHFNKREPHARMRIPADFGDDDLVICDYIRQQKQLGGQPEEDSQHE